ncbi:hypothetical protein NEOKW01_1799 [Nematocida sp. AWRm80]|nr:hypothetical protein NEOKW01_1799 [Nematocida sp. AWRm80]
MLILVNNIQSAGNNHFWSSPQHIQHPPNTLSNDSMEYFGVSQGTASMPDQRVRYNYHGPIQNTAAYDNSINYQNQSGIAPQMSMQPANLHGNHYITSPDYMHPNSSISTTDTHSTIAPIQEHALQKLENTIEKCTQQLVGQITKFMQEKAQTIHGITSTQQQPQPVNSSFPPSWYSDPINSEGAQSFRRETPQEYMPDSISSQNTLQPLLPDQSQSYKTTPATFSDSMDFNNPQPSNSRPSTSYSIQQQSDIPDAFEPMSITFNESATNRPNKAIATTSSRKRTRAERNKNISIEHSSDSEEDSSNESDYHEHLQYSDNSSSSAKSKPVSKSKRKQPNKSTKSNSKLKSKGKSSKRRQIKKHCNYQEAEIAKKYKIQKEPIYTKISSDDPLYDYLELYNPDNYVTPGYSPDHSAPTILAEIADPNNSVLISSQSSQPPQPLPPAYQDSNLIEYTNQTPSMPDISDFSKATEVQFYGPKQFYLDTDVVFFRDDVKGIVYAPTASIVGLTNYTNKHNYALYLVMNNTSRLFSNIHESLISLAKIYKIVVLWRNNYSKGDLADILMPTWRTTVPLNEKIAQFTEFFRDIMCNGINTIRNTNITANDRVCLIYRCLNSVLAIKSIAECKFTMIGIVLFDQATYIPENNIMKSNAATLRTLDITSNNPTSLSAHCPFFSGKIHSFKYDNLSIMQLVIEKSIYTKNINVISKVSNNLDIGFSMWKLIQISITKDIQTKIDSLPKTDDSEKTDPSKYNMTFEAQHLTIYPTLIPINLTPTKKISQPSYTPDTQNPNSVSDSNNPLLKESELNKKSSESAFAVFTHSTGEREPTTRTNPYKSNLMTILNATQIKYINLKTLTYFVDPSEYSDVCNCVLKYLNSSKYNIRSHFPVLESIVLVCMPKEAPSKYIKVSTGNTYKKKTTITISDILSKQSSAGASNSRTTNATASSLPHPQEEHQTLPIYHSREQQQEQAPPLLEL